MMLKAPKIIAAIEDILKSYGYFAVIWHVEDIHFICEQHDIPCLMDEEAMEVFKKAQDHFDGEVGISWPQLEQAHFAYIKQKDAMKLLCEESE